MHPDDAAIVIIRNHRFSRWPAVVLSSVGAVLLFGVGVLLAIGAWPPQISLLTMAVIVAASTAVCFGALTRFVVTGLKLTDVLQPYPAGTVYSPTNIKRINFAPDPCEDYHDSPLPIRLVEIKVDPTRGRSIRIIASVGDGRRLRDWAVRKGVEIFDPTNMLVETPGQTV